MNVSAENEKYFKVFLKLEITPAIRSDKNYVFMNEILYESELGKCNPTITNYIMRWCQVTRNCIKCFGNEWSSKNNKNPLFKIFIDEITSVTKSNKILKRNDI